MAKVTDKVDEFSSDNEMSSAWFTPEVGDTIKGTVVDIFDKDGNFGKQKVFVMNKVSLNREEQEPTEEFKYGINYNKDFLIKVTRWVKKGEIIGFKRNEDVDSKKFPGKKATSIKPYSFGMDDEFTPEAELNVEDIQF